MDGINFRDYSFNMTGYSMPCTSGQNLASEFNPFNFSSGSCCDTFTLQGSTSPVKSVGSNITNFSNIDITPQQAEEIRYLSDTIETNLTKKYPNGFKLVGIGRSPSLIIDIMKERGHDAISVPISGLTDCTYDIQGKYPYLSQLNSSDVKAYGDYLKEQGINTTNLGNKKLVFVDYTRTGTSLKHFEDLIARSEIGLNDKSKMAFLSLNRDLMPNHTLKDIEIIDRYWENLAIKNYSTVPRVEISEIGRVRNKVLSFNLQHNTDSFKQKLLSLIKNSVKYF